MTKRLEGAELPGRDARRRAGGRARRRGRLAARRRSRAPTAPAHCRRDRDSGSHRRPHGGSDGSADDAESDRRAGGAVDRAALGAHVRAAPQRESALELVAIAPLIAPAAPATLAVTATAAGVQVEWTAAPAAPPGAAAPTVTTSCGGAPEQAFVEPLAQLGADRLDHLDATAVYGERYIYTVRTRRRRASRWSRARDGPVRELEYRDRFAPPAPTGLVALAEEGRIRLLWDRRRSAGPRRLPPLPPGERRRRGRAAARARRRHRAHRRSGRAPA